MSKPFVHDHLPEKKILLDLAREFSDKGKNEKDQKLSVAYTLSSALLYMNHADYLAQFIAEGVTSIADDAVSSYFYGAITVNKKDFKDINIKQSMDRIKGYEFNRKKDVMTALGKINESRNTIAHSIIKTNPKDIPKVDEAVENLTLQTEELILIIDQIQPGMPPKNLMDFAPEQSEK